MGRYVTHIASSDLVRGCVWVRGSIIKSAPAEQPDPYRKRIIFILTSPVTVRGLHNLVDKDAVIVP